MASRRSEPGAWGELPLVVDTSAWVRAQHPQVARQWSGAVHADRLRISPVIRLEILRSARDGDTFDTTEEWLSALRPAPLTATIGRAAHGAMRTLAHRSAGTHRIPVVDYLTAATAQDLGAAVLHYDHDYDMLAEVLEFESIWLLPPGTVP